MKNVIRWILVLPVAVLAQFVFYGVGAVVFSFRTPSAVGLDFLFLEGLSGFAFVFVGTQVAPSRRAAVAATLVGLFATFGIVQLQRGASGPIGLLVALAGAGIGGYLVVTEGRSS